LIKEDAKMKYTKPMLEIFELETNDVIATSNQGSMTVDNVTITGPKDEFYADFSDLVENVF
jgi:lipopolysaccharide export system protein LptC